MPVLANEIVDMVNRVYINGVETVTEESFYRQDDVWGHVAIPNSRHEFKKLRNGSIAHSTSATIDKFGIRTSPASHRIRKKKHLLLLDSSTVFGEGLKDDETLSHIINMRSDIYEAYPIAFYGYGPQHMWLHFKEGKLPQQIKEKKGSAIILTHQNEIQRIFGSPAVMSFASRFPQLKETLPGNFILDGRFDNKGSYWQRLLAKYCVPYMLCSSKIAFFDTGVSDEQYQIAARVFESISEMYRNQFDVENVTLVWRGDEKGLKNFEKYSNIKIIPQKWFQNTFSDGHMSPESTKDLANSFFDAGLVQ
ncbi:hypothetical protein K2P97_05930 [bacterium]|nr:hypothetical protein [bacterium]